MRHAALIGGTLAAAMLCGCMKPRPTYEYEPTVTFTGTGSEPLKRQDDAPPGPAVKAPPATAVPAGVNLDGVAAGAAPVEPVAEPAAASAPVQAPIGGSAQRMLVTPDGALVSPDGKVLAPPGSVTPVQGIPAPPKKRATGWVHATD